MQNVGKNKVYLEYFDRKLMVVDVVASGKQWQDPLRGLHVSQWRCGTNANPFW